MTSETILAEFDNGATLQWCLKDLLANAGASRRELTARLLRAAMEMPDLSGRQVFTPVHGTDEILRVHVAGVVFELFDAPPPEGSLDGDVRAMKVRLRLDDQLPIREPGSEGMCQTVVDFITTSVMLRSGCSDEVMRDWLAKVVAEESALRG